jgi:branched-chain amino acid transport system substrate-binding protein
MRALALAALAALGGCSEILDFHECNSNRDCDGHAGPADVALFCTDQHQCIDPAPCILSTEPNDRSAASLTIGGLYRLSGDSSEKSIFYREASDLAAAQLNNNGQAVTHIACDTKGDPIEARTQFVRLIGLFHAAAVVGPDTSDELLQGIAPVIKQYGVPIISPAATNANITSVDDNDLIWRTAPTDLLQSAVLAQIVPDDVTAPLDIVYVDSSYASGLSDAFQDNWHGYLEQTIVFKSAQAADAVKKMNAPASALLIADVDAPALVAAVKTAPGLGTTQFYMTEGAVGPNLWGAAPYDFGFLGRFRGTSPGLRPATTDPSYAVYTTFSNQYAPRFGKNPDGTAYAANTYDAFYAIALAALAVHGQRNGAAIVANLKRLSTRGSTRVEVGANSISAALTILAGSANIDLLGASGPIDFTDKGDVATAPISIWHIENLNNSGQPYFHVTDVRTPPTTP